MTKYYLLIAIYLFLVASSSLANFIGLDVQNLYRVPFINIRWIDVCILLVLGSYFSAFINNFKLSNGNTFLISLCFLYLVFEIFQLAKSWKAIDLVSQISWFLCTLNFFILIDLLTFTRKTNHIIRLLEAFALWGAIVVVITNLYLVYSLVTGNVIFTDLDTRVAIDVMGAKETVSIAVLTPFVYVFSLYFAQRENVPWKRVIHLVAIVSIYLSLVISFHRGSLLTVILLTIIYIGIFFEKPSQAFSQIFGIISLIVICYFSFASILRQKGYDPIEKLTQIAKFTVDVDNPNWDKGRSLPREYAISVWKNHIWTGVGYDNLQNYGMPENVSSAHNFIITSLFHRGVIGTMIYVLILFLLFLNSVKFWFLLDGKTNYESNVLKLLIVVAFFWLIPFWTQEVMWEKNSLSIQFMYLGIITNIYRQSD